MQGRARIRGVVILYATIAVGMLGVLGSTMSDGSQAAVDAVQASMFTQMARYTAESGVEVGIAALDAHLAMTCKTLRFDTTTMKLVPVRVRNPACPSFTTFKPCAASGGQFTISWAEGEAGTTELVCAGPGAAGNANLSLYPMFPDGWQSPDVVTAKSGAEGDRESIAMRYTTSFALAMTPTFNTDNVFQKIKQSGFATFVLRSRGMVRGGKDPANPSDRMLLGHAVLVAKIRVGAACNGHARVQRVSMDLVPGFDRTGLKLPTVNLPH